MAFDHPILSTFGSLATVASPTAVTTTTTRILTNIAVASTSAIALLPTMETTPSDSPEDPDSNGECQLLGPFSLLVQAALGGLALLSLVYKRWKERPQRPIKIWAFDASKQVFGSCMLHLLNLLLSMFSAGQLEIRQEYQPNPCSFYLLNLGIDVSAGPCLSLAYFVDRSSYISQRQPSAFRSWYFPYVSSTALHFTHPSPIPPNLLNLATMVSLPGYGGGLNNLYYISLDSYG